MDIFYVPSKADFATASHLEVYKSWDDSFYGETNVIRHLAGKDRKVVGKDRRTGSPDMLVITIDGVRINCPTEILIGGRIALSPNSIPYFFT
jgi:hypothetical protein